MSNFDHNDEEDRIPPLIPIKKKKADQAANISTNEKVIAGNNNLITVDLGDKKDGLKSPIVKNQEKKFDNEKKTKQKKQKFQKKLNQKSVSKQKNKNNRWDQFQNEKSKENEKSKFLIAEMLNKLSIKNLTEQLYPVSNEVFEQLIVNIEKQIEELKHEVEKKQAMLAINPNNILQKKQLQTVLREINHCSTIKQLYHEKMNYRNKIKILQRTIIELKNENRDLKIKVTRGIETIENYKENLPSDMEKQLQQKINTTTQELKNQREMRQNLEKDMESIILNFKRLYDEADAARMIVTNKLKELQQRQKKLNKIRLREEEDGSDDSVVPKRLLSHDLISGSHNQSHNSTFINQGNAKRNFDQEPTNKKSSIAQKPTNSKQDEGSKKTPQQKLTMQQKIQKMRNNQFVMFKNSSK